MQKRQRRARGTGTIIQRKDGRLGARLPLGEGRYKWFYGTDEKELIDRLDQARLDLKRGIQPTKGRDTFSSYLPEWLEGVRATVRETSWEFYETLVQVHLVPKFGTKRLIELTAAQVRAYHAELLKAGYKTSYIGHIHILLRQALDQARIDHLVAFNVCRDVKMPRTDEPEMKTLTAEQRVIFLERTSETPYAALYALELYTGMRQGELLGLRWSDVDLKHGRLSVRRQRVRERDRASHTTHVYLRDVKTRRGRRDIDLGPNIVAILSAHKTQQAQQRMLLGPAWQGAAKHEDDLCFPTELGGIANAECLQIHCKRLFKRLGFDQELHFHSLRHTVATMLLERGRPIHEVARLLGDSEQTVLRVYAHVTERMKQETARITDELLWPEARG